LPKSEKQSRIIVTTRFQAIATACTRDKGDRIHKVVELIGDKPRQLFREAMAESKASNDDEEKQKEVPARLWEMCVGLPLAIVAIAGHVACNPHRSDEEWIRVCDSLVPQSVKYLAQDGVTRILAHCYNDMNAETKTCALYLSMFPKGRPVSRKRLMRRWIAEGFVSEKQGLSVEDDRT
jgi:disease resistance protein RPM1